MPADTFEYAIKKDVRNNPIVREVDRHRQREMWRSVGVGGLLVLVLLFGGGFGYSRWGAGGGIGIGGVLLIVLVIYLLLGHGRF